MDRDYHPLPVPESNPEPVLEEPIVPLRQLGTTVPEKLPTGANILQNTEAAIRAGMPNIQFVFTTPAGQALGGRPKAYGKEVREAIRSLAKVNEVLIDGVEMPSGSVNLSGFNQQNFTFSEQKRQDDLDEVRDYIKFTGDVAGGGGIDIWSAEFPRTVFDAKWNRTIDPKTNAPEFELYKGEKEQGTKYLVDRRTGRVIQEIRLNQRTTLPEWKVADRDYVDENKVQVRKGDYVDYEDRKVSIEERVPVYDSETKRFKVRDVGWEEFKEEAQRLSKELGREVKPEEAFFQATTLSQEAIAKGYEIQYSRDVDKLIEAIKKLKQAEDFYKKAEDNATTDEERMFLQRQADDLASRAAPGIFPPTYKFTSQIINEEIDGLRKRIKEFQNLAAGQRGNAEEQRRIRESVTTLDNYAKEKLFDSYAQMGIFAMQETQMNKNTERPIYVGPEIGWPTFWGGHPEEFKELIKESRKKMATLLSKPVLEDGKPNPYYAGMDEKAAKKRADEHIKGVFDTSHMGMWLNNYRRVPGESEEKRLEEFKKWYLGQVESLAKENIIGSIQAVDSATGAHGHLPPGQGIFPIAEAVQIFKKHGFDGAVISEGHEEEQFGQQRIFMQAMKYFGTTLTSPYTVGTGGLGGMPYRWGAIRNAYFGRTYTPMFIVGAYSPSNDFKLWSEVPLE